jgi:cytochrome b6-f complex iron-sulfur subunit
MDRKEFLSQLGLTGTALFAATCLGACSKSSAPTNVDLTIDLSSNTYSALKNAGGYVVTQGIIIARTTSNTYLAVSAACPHEGVQVQYSSGTNQFVCTAHGSYFSSTGAKISGPTPKGLTQYNTSLTGNSLRVYS